MLMMAKGLVYSIERLASLKFYEEFKTSKPKGSSKQGIGAPKSGKLTRLSRSAPVSSEHRDQYD